VVVRQGDDRGIGFFVIADGQASVSVDGAEVAKLGPGEHFGAIALIADRHRTATVTAETELHTYVMTLWDFRSFVQGDAEVAWKLLEQLAGMVQKSSAHQH
jgi:CRP-like cAMP-binding protein